ncbi:MAG: type II toxin-antitoxin system RelB/DinJ family antitoxin [Oscillospiraceae bacterium]|nr:type II toxin-antitoxin system RelB/DinJ family antitoxin [Oscillospiraceae bacterium]
MANTTAVYARIDTDLKENAENILSQLGISPSGAIQMLYSQIVLTGGLPFEVRLPVKKPLSIDEMTKEDLYAELEKGINDIKSGRTHTIDEVNEILSKR